MASPIVRVNTLFKQKRKPFIDPLSKLYIAAASFLGMNRLPIILNKTKYILTSLTILYSALLITGICYITYSSHMYKSSAAVMSTIGYTFDITFSFITLKRMERYYNELNKFDSEMGCRPKMTSQSLNNLILMVIFNVFFTTTFWLTHVWVAKEKHFHYNAIPINLLHCLEFFYYGHLLSLLVARLHLINYFMETALTNGKSAKCPNVENFRSIKSKNDKNTDMKKIMDLYYVTVKAYDFLVEAVKWQLLVIIITTFISTLTFCYNLSRELISEERLTVYITRNLNLIAMKMVSLFSPCIFGDRVHGEVRRLKELIASRLYENKLDKSGRSAARALLALTEARDLSFSLLRMLQVDISLPFKFIGLLVTYLIILLQFEKVINPTTAST